MGKKIQIECEAFPYEAPNFLRLVFTDYGAGIPADVINKVKSPFFSTKPAGRGTGLGLSISSGIINEHGGTLTIKSSDGEWTKVLIDLPTF